MKMVSFLRLAGWLCVSFAVAEFGSFAAPLITDFQPEMGTARTEVSILGTGFTGLSRILFTERSSGNRADSPFSLLSDTHVLTTVPSRVGSRWLISMFTPLGGTVTIPEGFFDITSETTAIQPSAVYLVRNGGVLTGGIGSSTVFVEAGGSYTGAGGGNLTVYVQQGAAYTHGNGGNNLIFYEPGATIDFGSGTGNIFTEVAELQPSFVPVPEPSGLALFLAGLAFVTLWRKRSDRR